jgi:glutamine amidotransferase
MNKKIVIVDYGMGNLHTLKRILNQYSFPVVVSKNIKDILSASHLILPGVGHFGRAMAQLKENDLIEPLNHMALVEKKPVLGICLGMQLMTAHSEEGDCEGLGWFPCYTSKLRVENDKLFKVPHLGWNTLNIKKPHVVFSDFNRESRMYFVHGYGVMEANPEHELCTTRYGGAFVSGICKENVIGLQFHPEKSHEMGQTIISNFVNKCIAPE